MPLEIDRKRREPAKSREEGHRSERGRIEGWREVVVTRCLCGHIHGLCDRSRLRRPRAWNKSVARSPVKVCMRGYVAEVQPRVLGWTVRDSAQSGHKLAIDSFALARRKCDHNSARCARHGRLNRSA